MPHLQKITLFLLFLAISPASSLAQDEPLRVLAISGGGARGAWGGGVIQALAQEHNRHYNTVIGTSTGSLLAPFVVGERYDELKNNYTNVRQKDIFNVNPFKKDQAKVKGLMAIFRVLFGKKTLGESKNLRKLIYKELPMAKYQDILAKGTFYATAIDFSTGDIYYHNSKLYDPAQLAQPTSTDNKAVKQYVNDRDALKNEMLDWIWVSGNQPVFMSLHSTKRDPNKKEKDYWVDGGVRENIPLLKALQLVVDASPTGVDTLDVIINNGKASDIRELPKPKVVQTLLQTIEILQFDVRSNDVSAAVEDGTESTGDRHDVYDMVKQMHEPSVNARLADHIHVYLYFMKPETKEILPESLLFNKEKMTKLWDRGMDYKNSAEIEHYVISKEEARKLVEPFRPELQRNYRPRLSDQ